jgi:hypothetical protein
LNEANTRYQEKIRKPLIRFDALPRQINLWTDRNYLQMAAMHANPYHIAAPGNPPELSRDSDLAVRVHESLVANFSESLLGGRTITDERLVELLANAGAEVPEELKIGPDKDPWSISFSPVQPIRVEFRDNLVRCAITGRRFSRGDQEIRNNIEIAATYQLQSPVHGIRMVRQGDVEVEYIGLSTLSIAQVTMKTFLRRKFEALFEPEIVSQGLQLGGRWQNAGVLQLIQSTANDHWLTLAWQASDDTILTASAN